MKLCFVASLRVLGRKYEITECSVTTTHHLLSCELKLLYVWCLPSFFTSVSLRQTRECSLRCFCLSWCPPPTGLSHIVARTTKVARWLATCQLAQLLADSQLASPNYGRWTRNAECAFVLSSEARRTPSISAPRIYVYKHVYIYFLADGQAWAVESLESGSLMVY